jgi:glycosyltransferase involved in cell wall biosynthesis
MPKILGDGGIYFDPEDPEEIAAALHRLVASPRARERYASIASKRVRPYTWERCADETFTFLKTII